MAQLVKTIGGLAIASVKTLGGLAIASVKTVAGLDNTSGGGTDFTYSTNGFGDGAFNQPSVSATVTVPAGALVVAYVKHEEAATTITVSDGTTTFTPRTKVSNGTTNHGQFFYNLASVASGSVTVTATFGANKDFPSIIVFVYTYTGTCSYDTEPSGGGATGTSTSPNSGNMTTSSGTTLQFGGYAEASATTASSPLINSVAADQSRILNGSSNNFTAMWSKKNTSSFTGAASCTLGVSEVWICNGVSFKSA